MEKDITKNGACFPVSFILKTPRAEFIARHSHLYDNFRPEVRDKMLGEVWDEAQPAKEAVKTETSASQNGKK